MAFVFNPKTGYGEYYKPDKPKLPRPKTINLFRKYKYKAVKKETLLGMDLSYGLIVQLFTSARYRSIRIVELYRHVYTADAFSIHCLSTGGRSNYFLSTYGNTWYIRGIVGGFKLKSDLLLTKTT